MNKNQPEIESKETTNESPAKKFFIVAGYGHVEADDISELPAKLKELDEQKDK